MSEAFPKPLKPPKLSRPILRSKRVKKARCKHCGYSYASHEKSFPSAGACNEYSAALGKKQKRKTPEKILREKCDDAWARLVKINGRCEITKPHECANGLQAMHGIPRTYKVTRHLPVNGFPGCGAIHYYYTTHPEEWSAYLVEAWGLETFRELWRSAQSMADVNLGATYEALRTELAKRTTPDATSVENGA